MPEIISFGAIVTMLSAENEDWLTMVCWVSQEICILQAVSP